MTEKVPKPIFTFRGHRSGVTAVVTNGSFLISGAEDGTVKIWNMSTFKCFTTWHDTCQSKILSLKVIQLNIESMIKSVLIVQSRDQGVSLHIFDHNNCLSRPEPLKTFSTYESLFSRGDALSIAEHQAILAYPSFLESSMITVRYMGVNAEIVLAGNATMPENTINGRSSVFDIRILYDTFQEKTYKLFAGYENGWLIMFSFSIMQTKSIPSLDVTGLNITIDRKFDLGASEFISAFDVGVINCEYMLVSGSPGKEIHFCRIPKDIEERETCLNVVLKRQGTSSIAIRPDFKLVAVAGWDKSLRIFSMKSRRHLATLKTHSKQVSDIAFYETKQDNDLGTERGSHLIICASLDGTISILDIY